MTTGRGRRGLGRGLDALLPGGRDVLEVEPARIEPNPEQPRQHFDREALESLAASIREHGVVQPLIVTRVGDDRYRLVIGERRWRAARLAEVPRVPVVVREATDRQTLEIALVENIQRADLNPLEEAAAYHRLTEDFGLTQQQVAQQVGRSRVAVANTLRLLALPDTVKRALIERRITEGHARALLGVGDAQTQLAVLSRVEREDLTVRQTEDLVRALGERPRPSAPPRPPDPNLVAIEDDLRRSLGTRVSVRPGKRGGRIVIEYFSDDEFQSLYDRLRG
ncbi:MAG TPA: ParB/RepB/Spo0J family partition protein [Chloroflexota bacterium]|nr:ParB/RepB/Spo0J family partition protein [Chloroflexota bacterium]